MQSFHRSRGRILFEVFCALAIAESFAGAWMQTHATAFLPAAVVSALYGIVRAFDMFGRKSTVAVAAAPQPTWSAVEPETALLADLELIPEESVQDDRPEPAAPRASRARRAKSAPKASRGRTKVREEKVAEPAATEEAMVLESPPEEAVVVEPTPPPEPEVAAPPPPSAAQVVKLTPPENVQPPAPPPAEETPPAPLTPLFEPQPFVRQQRGMFGRKAG